MPRARPACSTPGCSTARPTMPAGWCCDDCVNWQPIRGFYQMNKTIDIHFDDLDPIGVVHNARYAVLLERAISLYWWEHGLSFVDSRPNSPDMVAVVREFSITYHAPIRGTGPVDIEFWLDHMGSSSAVYGFRFQSVDQSTVYAEGKR